MKNLIFAITLLLSINICAQNELENRNVFVRVYDFQGKKIGKGNIFSISDSYLQLNWKRASVKIPVSSIGSIKTKRSAGNNVLLGATVGATSLAILGGATASPDDYIFGYTATEGVVGGVVVGGTAGAVIGGITIVFKKSKSYEINGDKLKLKTFKELIIE